MATPHLTIKPATPRLNRRHPLARDVLLCIPFEDKGGTVYTDIGDLHNDGAEGASGTYVQSEYGSAASFAAGAEHIGFGPEDALGLETGGGTFFILYEKNDGTNRGSGLFGIDGGDDNRRSGVLGPWSDGTVYWDFGGSSGSNRLTSSGQTFERALWVFTAGPRGMEIWKNGLLLSSSATAVTRVSSASPFALGNHSGVLGDDVTYHFFAAFNRQLEQSETIAFSADPFAIVRPPARKIVTFAPTVTTFTGSGTPILPSLTAAGVAAEEYIASGTPSLPALQAAGTALEIYIAAGDDPLNLPALTAAGVGVQTYDATGTPSLPSLQAAGVASLPIVGSGTPILPSLEAAGVGELPFIASGTPSLPALEAAGTALEIYIAAGDAALSLPSLTAAGTGTVAEFIATGAANLPALQSAGTALEIYIAASDDPLNLPSLQAAGTAVETYDATGTPSLPSLTSAGVATVASPVTASGTPILPALIAAGVASNGSDVVTAIGAAILPSLTARGRSILGTLAENIAADLATFFGLSDFGEAATYIDRTGAVADKPIQVIVDRAETLVLPETGMLAQESLIVHVPNDRTLGVTRIRTGDLITVAFRVGDTPSQKMITRVISSNTASFEVEVVG